jgi:membrane fusion protein, multidrug efflux system
MNFVSRLFSRSGVCLCFILLGSGCREQKHREEEKVSLPSTQPVRRDTDVTKNYVAQIRSIQHIELRALERGYLEKTFVDEGQLVKKGQRLFQIMPAVYEAELQKAQAEAQFAQIEFDNTKSLADQKVVSPNELALGKAKLAKANAEVALSKVHRDLTEIRAPFDGIVGRFMVRIGSLLDEGQLLTTLSDNSKVWVYFNVSESEYLDYKSTIQSGAPLAVKLMMANGKLFDQVGHVETIEADFNNDTGTIAFRAGFENPQSILRHGETGNILVAKPLSQALIIPQKATFEVMDKRFVFVIDASSVVHARQISISEELPQIYVVQSGLDEKEHILLEGLPKVKDGDKITVKHLDPLDVLTRLEVPAQ